MISLIVGHDKNHLIGSNNALPWHIKEDLQHFKNYTLNKTVVMGYNTFLSIGKPLPNRTNIVVCNDKDVEIAGVIVEKDLFEVLKKYGKLQEELVVIGGATIYKLSLPYCDKLVISKIKGEYTGDTYFPEYENDFNLVKEEVISELVTVCYYERKK